MHLIIDLFLYSSIKFIIYEFISVRRETNLFNSLSQNFFKSEMLFAQIMI